MKGKSHTLRPLYTFQKAALQRSYSAPRVALYWEMRLGKTLVILRRLRRMAGPFMVVAPNDALISWKKELAAEQEPFLDLSSGTAKQRDWDLIAGLQDFFHLQRPRYFLLNKEGFLSLPRISTAPWEGVILDESTFIKNPKAKVTQFFLRHFKATPFKAILTGTPAPESPLNYVCQLLFLEPRWLAVKNFWDFRAKYCKPYGYDWSLTAKGTRLLLDTLKNCHVLKRQDVGLDRKKIYEQRSVQLPPALRRVYDGIVKDFMLEYKGISLDTNLAMRAFQWLRQLASGFIGDQLVFPDKISVIKDLLAGELKGQPAIIWTNLVLENVHVTSALLGEGFRVNQINGGTPAKERARLVADFQQGALDYLVAQVPCATFGLNFSRASVAFYYSCPFGFLQRRQSEDRILSTQSRGPLLYIDLITEDTIDEDILQGISEKQSAQVLQRTIIRRLDAHHRKAA